MEPEAVAVAMVLSAATHSPVEAPAGTDWPEVASVLAVLLAATWRADGRDPEVMAKRLFAGIVGGVN